jgi:hypothetical protein
MQKHFSLPPTFGAKNWRLNKCFFDRLLLQPPSTKLGTFMRGQGTKFALAFHGAPKHVAQGIHERPSVKKCTWPPTFDTESWR